MKIIIKKTSPSEQFIGLAYALIGFTGFVLAHFEDFILDLMPRCMFRYLTGLPCPSCGATRSGIYLSHLQIWRSFLENPLYFFLYVALFIFAVNSIIGVLFHKNLGFKFHTPRRKVYIFLLFAIFLNWAYLIIRTAM